MLPIALLWLLGSAAVDPGLEHFWLRARLDWGVDKCPRVTEVRWCDPVECDRMTQMDLVGEWHYDTGRVDIRRDWQWTHRTLQSTVTHEVGHGLGLLNKPAGGIMGLSWAEPIAIVPTPEERLEVRKEFYCEQNSDVHR